MQWQSIALVMAGGALGAAMRFFIGEAMLRQLGTGFPWGTLLVNLIGSFAAGYMLIWLESCTATSAAYWRAFLVVGVLGSLTTYSALMVDCLVFAKAERPLLGALYLLTSLVAGLALVWLGSRVASLGVR